MTEYWAPIIGIGFLLLFFLAWAIAVALNSRRDARAGGRWQSLDTLLRKEQEDGKGDGDETAGVQEKDYPVH